MPTIIFLIDEQFAGQAWPDRLLFRDCSGGSNHIAFSFVLYIMDSMFGQNDNSIKDSKNNLKDTNGLGITLKDNGTNPVSYSKTNKLITALYMVTDILDKEEPIRLKLRTIGTGILSDMHSVPLNALPKILEMMSFLDIAGAVNMISEMNLNILRKEFFELKNAIGESLEIGSRINSEVALSELFDERFSLPSTLLLAQTNEERKNVSSARIGVQKGSTLLKAIKDIRIPGQNSRPNMSDKAYRTFAKTSVDHGALKGQRREEIIKIIKLNPAGATITDIKAKAAGMLANCSEKTLQRELAGMLQKGVLKKTGEKRWSRYFLA